MKNKNLIRRVTAGFTAFAAAVACSATSTAALPTVVAADDTDNYAKLLQYSMYLYDGNMCGKEVEQKSAFLQHMTWMDGFKELDQSVLESIFLGIYANPVDGCKKRNREK